VTTTQPQKETDAMKTIDRSYKIAQIAACSPSCTGTLEAYGVNLRDDAESRIDEFCRAKHMDPTTLWAALDVAALGSRLEPIAKIGRLSVDDIIAIIVSKHHAFLRTQLPLVCSLAAKVTRSFGDRNAKLYEIQRNVEALQERLLPHLEMEERVLFPAFLEASPSAGLFSNDVVVSMYEDHRTVAEALAALRVLSDGYAVPDWADGNYEVLMSELAALEKDLHRHVHIENDVLMPKFVTHRPSR
jgi:regulator of cell morphogenesis and NO signaling